MPFITVAAEAPGKGPQDLRYALMRGTYPLTSWWTGSEWRPITNKQGRIAWYHTRERANEVLLERMGEELETLQIERNLQYWRFTRRANAKPVDPALMRQIVELEEAIAKLKFPPGRLPNGELLDPLRFQAHRGFD